MFFNKKYRQMKKQITDLENQVKNLKHTQADFNDDEINLILHLLLQEEIVNGMGHDGFGGLFSKENTALTDVIWDIRQKLDNIKKRKEREKGKVEEKNE